MSKADAKISMCAFAQASHACPGGNVNGVLIEAIKTLKASVESNKRDTCDSLANLNTEMRKIHTLLSSLYVLASKYVNQNPGIPVDTKSGGGAFHGENKRRETDQKAHGVKMTALSGTKLPASTVGKKGFSATSFGTQMPSFGTQPPDQFFFRTQEASPHANSPKGSILSQIKTGEGFSLGGTNESDFLMDVSDSCDIICRAKKELMNKWQTLHGKMGVPYSKPIPSNPPDDHPAFSLESIKSTKTKGFSKKSTKSTLPTLAMPTKKESKKTVIESTEVPLVFDAQILKPTPSKELPASKKPLETVGENKSLEETFEGAWYSPDPKYSSFPSHMQSKKDSKSFEKKNGVSSMAVSADEGEGLFISKAKSTGGAKRKRRMKKTKKKKGIYASVSVLEQSKGGKLGYLRALQQKLREQKKCWEDVSREERSLLLKAREAIPNKRKVELRRNITRESLATEAPRAEEVLGRRFSRRENVSKQWKWEKLAYQRALLQTLREQKKCWKDASPEERGLQLLKTREAMLNKRKVELRRNITREEQNKQKPTFFSSPNLKGLDVAELKSSTAIQTNHTKEKLRVLLIELKLPQYVSVLSNYSLNDLLTMDEKTCADTLQKANLKPGHRVKLVRKFARIREVESKKSIEIHPDKDQVRNSSIQITEQRQQERELN